MVKRLLILGFVGVVLAVAYSGHVSASRYLRIGGILIETGSIISTVQISKVQGLTENPFRVIEYTLLDVAVTCRNPQGMLHSGLAYNGPPKKIQGASSFTLDDDPFGDKTKNTATSKNSIDPEDAFTPAEVCPNRNWSIESIEVFGLGFTDTIFRCVKKGNNPCASFQAVDVLTGECTLSGSQYNCFNFTCQHDGVPAACP